MPDPGNPLIFPSPRPEGHVEPEAACAGDTVILHASKVPPNTTIEVWAAHNAAGGWKVGNPPAPSKWGAVKLGEATSDAMGRLMFPFIASETLFAQVRQGTMTDIALWLVYPEANGKTPIQPTVALVSRCQDPPNSDR